MERFSDLLVDDKSDEASGFWATLSQSIFVIPIIVCKIFKVCFWADHIHLRCPGNIGLLGVLVQVFFPKKIKTVKYAGNWDPNSKQPKTYILQKKILSNTCAVVVVQVEIIHSRE